MPKIVTTNSKFYQGGKGWSVKKAKEHYSHKYKVQLRHVFWKKAKGGITVWGYKLVDKPKQNVQIM